jgi:hypothetical protein
MLNYLRNFLCTAQFLLTENNIRSSCQSGFRKNHSTASALLAKLIRIHAWLLNMHAGMINGVLFLDLCKAFDTVDHRILLYTAKNHFLIKKKILNLRNYFLKRETGFLNKKNDS